MRTTSLAVRLRRGPARTAEAAGWPGGVGVGFHVATAGAWNVRMPGVGRPTPESVFAAATCSTGNTEGGTGTDEGAGADGATGATGEPPAANANSNRFGAMSSVS